MISTKTSIPHPSTALGLRQPYTELNITKKNGNKEYLMETLGLSSKKKVLLVAVVLTKAMKDLDEAEMKMLSSMKEALSSVSSISPVFVFAHLTKDALAFAGEFPSYESSEEGIPNVELLSGADTFLFVEKNPKNIHLMAERILSFGGIIVAHNTQEVAECLQQYNPFTEQGSSFLYEGYSPWGVFASVLAVYNVFQFSYDWNTIRKRAMSSACS